MTLTFRKRERMVSQRLIDDLFAGGSSHSVAAFPLRAVYKLRERNDHEVPLQMLISVPKKHFHHAVDRNRVKRQVREAYRHSKQRLYDTLPDDKAMILAFIWLSDRHLPTADVGAKVSTLVDRLSECLRNG